MEESDWILRKMKTVKCHKMTKEKVHGSSFGISEADQLSQYDDDSSDDNDSLSEEDGAEPQLLNKELGFLLNQSKKNLSYKNVFFFLVKLEM